MPSSGRFSPDPGTRLPQRVALGVLLRSFPPPLVDEILDDLGRREQRQRLLPARLMVYFTLGMWIFRALPYELILAELLRDAPGLAPPVSAQEQASAAAIGRARRRLGVEPLRRLFEQSGDAGAGAAPLLRGRRPLRLCDVDVGMPATPANLLGFPALAAAHATGPPGHRPDRARIRLLVECGSRRITCAEVVGADQDDLPPGVGPEDLLVLDPRPLSAPLWTALEQIGAHVLWPLPESVQLSGGTRLPDGSVLAKLAAQDGSELVARVLATGRGTRLATSLLDHRAAPAGEIAACYDDPAVAERRLHGIGAYGHDDRLELRSKDPEMVHQELYAMLCVHHAIGELVGPTPGDSGCF
ncbi:transposase domain-containing protein [Actinospica durhamensis]|uniref:Transposase domain-containing protein n=1 Tax=Actinospica durhamensis TaxID=1508375 RepID=A0A941EU38_9ACTN|nr:transposase domain-containing protein [Actinospica durhamensis]MBR7838127.1 transposase domain-containing protein [Actinospica durhamensis]